MGKPTDPVKTRDHSWTQERLSDYIDGALQAEDRDRVERHLRECGQCSADLADLRQTVALLHAMPVHSVPRVFTIHEAHVSARLGRHPWLPYLRLGTALAGLLLLLMVFVDVWASLSSIGSLGMGGVRSVPVPLASPSPRAEESRDLVAIPTTQSAPASTTTAGRKDSAAAPAAQPPSEPPSPGNEMFAQQAAESPEMVAPAPAAPPSLMPKGAAPRPTGSGAGSDRESLSESPVQMAPAPAAPPGIGDKAEGEPPSPTPAPVQPGAADSAIQGASPPITSPPVALKPALPDQAIGAAAAVPTIEPTGAAPAAERVRSAIERDRLGWRFVQLGLSVVFLVCLLGWLVLDRSAVRRR